MDFGEGVHQLTWLFVVVPAIVLASAITADNRFWGPYFPLADVVLGDPAVGLSWRERKVLLALVRRAVYAIALGLLLSVVRYSNVGVASVCLLAGFLLIWPAFLRPFPTYVNRSDWQVLVLWMAYIAACGAFGLAGANIGTVIRSITGQSPWQYLRDNLLFSALWFAAGIAAVAFRAPVAGSLSRRVSDRTDRDSKSR